MKFLDKINTDVLKDPGRIFLGVMISVAVIGLSLGGILILKNGEDALYVVKNPVSAFFILISISAVYIQAAFLWRRFSAILGREKRFAVALIDIGIMSLGKYVPGKIWGIVGRAGITERGNRSKGTIISFVEQLYSLYVGVIYAFCLTSVAYAETLWTYIGIPIIGCIAVFLGLKGLVFYLRRVLPKNNFKALPETSSCEIFFIGFGYIIMWFTTTIPVLLIVFYLGYSSIKILTLISGAFALSMAIGWIALILPGGIGVRETIFGLLMGSSAGWTVSVSWILAHRILVTISDMIIGFVSLIMVLKWRRKTSQLLNI
jgi:hypothetical protein